jgi:hypothetical protein
MKTLMLALALAVAPAAVVAQTAPSPVGAAATIPNTFDGPAARAAPVATTAAPAAQAPDIARAEAALRSVITAAQGVGFDYTAFTPDLATKIREQEAVVTPLLKGFGALQTVAYVGQENGADMFAVTFASQATQWIIGFDDEDRIAALLFRPAPET